MNGMGFPVETRVLHDGQLLTPEAFVARRLHPANAGQVLTGITVDVDLDLRVCGGDGHTISPPPKSHRAADPRLPGNKTARTTEPEREYPECPTWN